MIGFSSFSALRNYSHFAMDLPNLFPEHTRSHQSPGDHLASELWGESCSSYSLCYGTIGGQASTSSSPFWHRDCQNVYNQVGPDVFIHWIFFIPCNPWLNDSNWATGPLIAYPLKCLPTKRVCKLGKKKLKNKNKISLAFYDIYPKNWTHILWYYNKYPPLKKIVSYYIG